MAEFPTTIQEIQQGLRQGDFSSVELTKHVFERLDKTEPQVHAFIEYEALKSSALEAAQAADARGYGEDAPLLNGVPLAIKDNIHVEGFKMTAGSQMLENFTSTFDATPVTKLKEAGAVLVGKTNMDEFAMGATTETSYFGKTFNPWNTTHVPGGSSGGSAAAVAARQVPGTLGTDTGGSIRQPAAFTGIVGMKPTYGIVSRYGTVQFAASLDVVGPMTLSVADNALLLKAIAGHDAQDSTSEQVVAINYSEKLGQSLEGLKIAFPKEYQAEGIDGDIRQQMTKAAEFFQEQGAVVEEVSLETLAQGINAYYVISSAEGSSSTSRYDGIHYGYRSPNAKDLDDVYFYSRNEAFGDEVKRRILFGSYIFSGDRFKQYYEPAAKVRTLLAQEIASILDEYDVIMGPTTSQTAGELDGVEADEDTKYLADLLTVSANLAGLPALSIPAGFDQKGLPIGMQLLGKSFDEGTLYQVGHAFEVNHDFINQAPKL